MSALVFLSNAAGSTYGTSSQPSLVTDYCNRFYGYWASLRRTSIVPDRSDFDPADILDMLTHVLILELAAPSKITFRLLGSAHDRRFGEQFLGANFLDLIPERLRSVRSDLFWSAGLYPCGIQIIRRNVSSEMSGQDYELILLPIRARQTDHPLQMIGVGWPLEGPWRSGTERSLAHETDQLTFIDLGAGVPRNTQRAL